MIKTIIWLHCKIYNETRCFSETPGALSGLPLHFAKKNHGHFMVFMVHFWAFLGFFMVVPIKLHGHFQISVIFHGLQKNKSWSSKKNHGQFMVFMVTGVGVDTRCRRTSKLDPKCYNQIDSCFLS